MAAVVLAIEVLLFEFSVRAVVPLIVASSVAGGVHIALFGSQPLFRVENHEFSGLGELWLFALLGVACGLLAVVICRGLFAVEAIYRRLPLGEFWHPLIGGLGFGLIGLMVPRVLGTGYPTIQDTLSARLAVATLAAVFVGKLLAWWVTLGSMLATVLADLVANALLDQNLLTEKLARKGVLVPRGYEPDILRHTPVRAAMTAPADTLPADVTIAEARRRIAQGAHRAYPLVAPDQTCAGIVTRGDLLSETLDDSEPVAFVASADVVTVSPDDSMLHALSRLVDEGVNQLPVVERGVVVGICTRTDVLRVRGHHLAQE